MMEQGPPSIENRLQHLLNKVDMTEDEIEEAFQLTKELGMTLDEIPLRLLDQKVIQSLTAQLKKLRAERQMLELQANIHGEKEKIRELLGQKDPYWCKECQAWVSD